MLQGIEIEWERSDGTSVQSLLLNGASELRGHLVDLDAKARTDRHPIVANAITNDEHGFGIGLGHEGGTILTYNGYKGNPPYFISAGDETRTEMVNFSYMGSYSEYPASCLIPLELGINALIDSLERRGPSPMIKWDEC